MCKNVHIHTVQHAFDGSKICFIYPRSPSCSTNKENLQWSMVFKTFSIYIYFNIILVIKWYPFNTFLVVFHYFFLIIIWKIPCKHIILSADANESPNQSFELMFWNGFIWSEVNQTYQCFFAIETFKSSQRYLFNALYNRHCFKKHYTIKLENNRINYANPNCATKQQ